mmetsp:Transcript_31991/g.49993  ORF Transcript_31991/g.49993 Transcript_31991/m.49993 type:complete len:82 (+) Transcript_31991:44-289(+)
MDERSAHHGVENQVGSVMNGRGRSAWKLETWFQYSVLQIRSNLCFLSLLERHLRLALELRTQRMAILPDNWAERSVGWVQR